jgi:hypothetical protein
MDYEDARSEIKSGDILAFSHVGWKNWHDIKIQAVRMFTQSEYSHLATAWVMGGRVFVIEAVMPLVRIYPLSKLGDFYWIPMDAPWTSDTEEFALAAVGNKYSQLQAIQAFFAMPRTDSLWECAEFSQTVAARDGIVIDCNPTPSKVVKQLQLMGKDIKFVKN